MSLARRAGWGVRILSLFALLALVPAPTSFVFSEFVIAGDAALLAHNPASALSAYQDALARRPGDAAVFERMARAAEQAGRPEMAAAYRAELARQDGWTPDRLRAEGDALAAAGDSDRAAPYWEASLSGSRADQAVLNRLADASIQALDWGEAWRRLIRAASIDPSDAYTAYRTGLIRAPFEPEDAILHLDYAAADPHFTARALAIRDAIVEYRAASRSELAFRLGLAMANQDEWAFAEQAFRLSLGIERTNPAALAFLGLAQDRTGRDGWPPIRQALDLAPNDALVKYATGVHWRLNGDPARALEALKAARTLDAENPAIAAELGLAYQDAGQPSEALLYLTTANELAPDDPAFRRLLASFIADGSYDLPGQGLTLLQSLAAEAPDDPHILASLGWALLTSREILAARDVLNRAVALDVENPRTRFYFAALLEMEGDLEGALESYRFAANSPDGGSFSERARRAIERLDAGGR